MKQVINHSKDGRLLKIVRRDPVIPLITNKETNKMKKATIVLAIMAMVLQTRRV